MSILILIALIVIILILLSVRDKDNKNDTQHSYECSSKEIERTETNSKILFLIAEQQQEAKERKMYLVLLGEQLEDFLKLWGWTKDWQSRKYITANHNKINEEQLLLNRSKFIYDIVDFGPEIAEKRLLNNIERKNNGN